MVMPNNVFMMFTISLMGTATVDSLVHFFYDRIITDAAGLVGIRHHAQLFEAVHWIAP